MEKSGRSFARDETKPIRPPRQKLQARQKALEATLRVSFRDWNSSYHEIQPLSVVLRVRSIQFGQEIVKDCRERNDR